MVRSWLRSGALREKRIILQVRCSLLENSQKRISLTQLPGGPVAPIAPARTGFSAAELNDLPSLRQVAGLPGLARSGRTGDPAFSRRRIERDRARCNHRGNTGIGLHTPAQ